MKLRLPLFLTLAVLVLAFLVSCGPGAIGTAVILWPAEEWSIGPGAMVPVMEESDIRNSYTIRIPASDQTITTAKWRVRFFESREEAQAFAEEFEPYAEQYGSIAGRPERLGAQRVYTTPEARSERTVYRLRSDERFKILGRTEEPANEGGAVAHWYQILTRDGTTGWVFGYYLRIDGQPVEVRERTSEADEELQTVLQRTWRPGYFQDMIDSGHVDLDRFHRRYGFFPDPEDKSIRLRLPEHEITFNYTDVIRGSRGGYVFEGSSLQLDIRNRRRISIQYELDGDMRGRTLYALSEDISSIIEEEKRRREQVYEEFLSRGNTLLSTAYGTIRLLEDREFEWEGYGRLVPSVVPENAGNRGSVLFSYFPAEAIENRFDGVVAFQFAGQPSDEDIVFLYNFREDGLRLSRVEDRDIDDNVVERESISPLIMFFSFDRQDTNNQQSTE
ncbi:MAG: SH3 domain-containing protein [bacterium]